jgi:hypothetical protein
MKTYIKKPKVEKFTTLSPLEEKASILSIFDQMEEDVCGGLDGLSDQLECGENGGILCQLVEAIGNLLGCDERECAVDEDCDDWEDCVEGLCELAEGSCEVSADCDVHETCQDHECVETGCDHPDVDCSDYEECVEDECIPTGDCRHPHIDCPSEMHCNPSGVCVQCTGDEHCPEIAHCSDGMCVPDEGHCYVPLDCGKSPGETRYDCINNECELCAIEDGGCEEDADCCDNMHCWGIPEDHCSNCKKHDETCTPPPIPNGPLTLNGPPQSDCCNGLVCIDKNTQQQISNGNGPPPPDYRCEWWI